MSSTNRGKERHLDDLYQTPPPLCQFLCEHLKKDFLVDDDYYLLEPGCGEGYFLDAMVETWPYSNCVGIDINPELVDTCISRGHEAVEADILKMQIEEQYVVDGIIGNPPFKHANQFIQKLLPTLSQDGVMAFLLRLNFLGGQKRFKQMWSKDELRPSHIYVLPARPGFTKDGKTDSIEYMFCVWLNDYNGPTTIEHLNNLNIKNKW